MQTDHSIQLVGSGNTPSIAVTKPLGGTASRRLSITGLHRWQIVGRLRQTATGVSAVAFEHPDAIAPLLEVDDGGAWTLRGDVQVSSGKVRVEHPVILSACVSGHPTAPNGTRARVNAVQEVRLAVVGAPPTDAPSCTVVVGGVGAANNELPAKPQLPPSGIVVADVATSGAWTFSKPWQVLSELQPAALVSVDFSSVTPEAQVLGHEAGELAYRTGAGTTLKLAP